MYPLPRPSLQLYLSTISLIRKAVCIHLDVFNLQEEIAQAKQQEWDADLSPTGKENTDQVGAGC
jgi:hypothetical protein